VQAKPPVQVEPHPSKLRKAASADEPKEAAPPADPSAATVELTSADWPKILAAVKAKHNTLYSIVRTVRPHFEPGKITLECGVAFYQKRLNENRNKELLAEVLKEVCGQSVRVASVLGEAAGPDEIAVPDLPPEEAIIHTVQAEPVSAPPQSEALKNISNIFGGAELLES
ncbi:MAG TPA: hypothetical protein VKQ34_02595, partial [Candidatus Saccharimonadales bacterium]|nr:hypothetical protein [Candidatus Saccharimonadales bacterium]